MTNARGHGAIVYCLNSGSDDIQTGSHNGDEGEEPFPGWRKRKKPCPGWEKHERRALVGTDGKRALKKRSYSEIGVERKERR
ncbi:hypothetical protein TNCV_1458511 [Trichonephila clavipes]|nr:hypothetical protein TNCV_1458511 [Trichonephila clavipes]